jgi:preprotein translocase subunit Sec61beta
MIKKMFISKGQGKKDEENCIIRRFIAALIEYYHSYEIKDDKIDSKYISH